MGALDIRHGCDGDLRSVRGVRGGVVGVFVWCGAWCCLSCFSRSCGEAWRVCAQLTILELLSLRQPPHHRVTRPLPPLSRTCFLIMATPQAIRRWVLTGAVTAVTVFGTLYGAGLRSDQQLQRVCTPRPHLLSLRRQISVAKKTPIAAAETGLGGSS